MTGATLILLLAAFCNQSMVAGSCLDTTVVESLDLKRLAGQWYQHSSYGTLFTQGYDRCLSTKIILDHDGKGFSMENDRVSKLLNIHIRTTWKVRTNSDGDSEKVNGDLTLKMSLPIIDIGSLTSPLKVLGTDYSNYAVFYICRSFIFFQLDIGLIFTRKRVLKAKELETLYSLVDPVLRKNNIPRSNFYLTVQRGCLDESSTFSDNNNPINPTSIVGGIPDALNPGVQVAHEISKSSSGYIENKKLSQISSVSETEKNSQSTTENIGEKSKPLETEKLEKGLNGNVQQSDLKTHLAKDSKPAISSPDQSEGTKNIITGVPTPENGISTTTNLVNSGSSSDENKIASTKGDSDTGKPQGIQPTPSSAVS